MAKRNTKRLTVKALLANDTMAKIIKEALDSPIGSTPRKRAKKIVSIMNKLHRYDGAGGPGVVSTVPQQNLPTVAKRRIRTNVRVFPEAPKMAKDSRFDGAGGGFSMPSQYAGSMSGINVSDLQGSAYNPNSGPALLSNNGPSANTGINTTAGNMPSVRNLIPKSSQYNGIFSGAAINPNFSAGQNTGGLTGWAGQSNVGGKNTFLVPSKGVTPTSGSTPLAGTAAGAGTFKFDSTKNPTIPASFGIGDRLSAYNVNRVMPGAAAAWNSGQSSTSSSSSDTTTETGGDTSGFSDDYSFIDGYMGPSAFAAAMMNDVEKLRQIPGFENVPPDALPYGASLSGQLDRIWNVSIMDSGLNQAMDELEGSINSYNDYLQGGVGLQTRLTDYIRRKDEYLNETTGMIDDFREKVYSGAIDTYDPAVAKLATSYVGYLSTLQGRQNKRYVEWLNGSLDAYKTQVEASSQAAQNSLTLYDRKRDDFTYRYERGEKIAITEYTQLRDMLMEAYNTAAGAPALAREAEKAETEMAYTYAQTLDLLKKAGVDGGKFSSSNAADRKTIEANLSILNKDKNGLNDLGRNIMAMWENGGVGDFEPVLDYYKSNIHWDFEGTANTSETYRNAMTHFSGIDSMIGTILGYQKSGDVTAEDAASYVRRLQAAKEEVRSGLQNTLVQDVNSDVEKQNTFRDAVTDLVANKKTRVEFIKEYSAEGLPQSLLGAMYDTVAGLFADGGDVVDFYSPDGGGNDGKPIKVKSVPSEDLIRHVINVSLDRYVNNTRA